MKNKTLEEAAQEYYPGGTVEIFTSEEELNWKRRIAFKTGANYQKSVTPFSEEDMLSLIEWCGGEEGFNLIDEGTTTKELLELYLKNKKK